MENTVIRKRPLFIGDILKWADAHRESTGRWPTRQSGTVLSARFETWHAVDGALRHGLRDLPGGSSLAQLLADERGARNIHALPPLTEEQILRWADDHHARTETWPTAKSGLIPGSGGETWAAIDLALRGGRRSLSGGQSLAQLLAARRGTRNRKALPRLSEGQILAWADAHHARTGRWPHQKSGAIPEAPGEGWLAVDMALHLGRRGFPGGSSLARLLAERRGVRKASCLPDLALPQILGWVDAFHARTGGWPHLDSGPIPEAPGETWSTVNRALKRGRRGLPGGVSLAELLAAERGVRNNLGLPRLTRRQVLAWADAHRRRTGDWPTGDSGPVAEAPGESWSAIDTALHNGLRGLRGGSSLARLLAQYRGRCHRFNRPRLSHRKIMAWADAHHARTGEWPNVNSGPVPEAPGERWDRIDNALRQGDRGLRGGSSLLLLLVRKRGVRHPLHLPPLTEDQVWGWARAHFQRTGEWPRYDSGPVVGVPGETWSSVDFSLREGRRGFPGGSSLAQLLAKRRQETATPEPVVPG